MEAHGDSSRPDVARTTKRDHLGALLTRHEAGFIHVEDATGVETAPDHEPRQRVEQEDKLVFSVHVPCSRYCLRLPVGELGVALHKTTVSPVGQGSDIALQAGRDVTRPCKNFATRCWRAVQLHPDDPLNNVSLAIFCENWGRTVASGGGQSIGSSDVHVLVERAQRNTCLG